MDFGFDPAVILLFDITGYIAGIQTHLNKGVKIPVGEQNEKAFFQESDEGYTLTMYFIEPSKICGTGRSPQEFEEQGTGTDLIIQYGSDPENESHLMKVPKTEKEAEEAGWVGRKCVPTMGRHYWYNVHKNSGCKDTFPFFILFDGGNLNAFAFVFPMPLGFPDPLSPRYEQNDNKVSMSMSYHEVPECWTTDDESKGKWIVMHVYMSNPYLNLC